MDIHTLANMIVDKSNAAERYIVAIAGPPASGKSTLAAKLCVKIRSVKPEANPICVPMDGFHLSNNELKEMGLLARKGAPNTFDSQKVHRNDQKYTR